MAMVGYVYNAGLQWTSSSIAVCIMRVSEFGGQPSGGEAGSKRLYIKTMHSL